MYSIKIKNCVKVVSFSLCALLLSSQSFAKDWLVETPTAYKKALSKLVPGDTIILANGTWNNFEIVFKGNGTKDKPLHLTAQTKGKVILSGQSNLKLAGKHLLVSGLVFKNGYTPTSEVISFQLTKKELAHHSRVTEVVIDNYSNPDRFESDYWVGIYGKYNRFDHNHLVGKRNKGVTLAVRLTTAESQENYHRIDHNYFGPRPILGSNGGETLRVGTSHYSLTDSFTTVENNYFDRCDGEVEIISVKSGKNKILNNTFFESRGTLTLRHGNGNLIEGNVFLGNGVDHTGGIRVINRDQTVRNNYLEGLTGYRFGSGFTVMNGVPNSSINRYHQVVNAKIENNTFVNVKHIQLAAGSDAERSAAPLDTSFKNNVFYNEDNVAPFSTFDDISGIAFNGNVSNKLNNNKIKSGIKTLPLTMKRSVTGLLVVDGDETQQVGASKTLTETKKSDTGVSWYEKKEPITAFNSGKTIKVLPGINTVFNAVNAAADGDVLLLSAGEYLETKIISLNKTLTIKVLKKNSAQLTFERSTLFEILDHGSLSLDGITISGKESPDSSGNVLARTAKWGMMVNYRFEMRNSLIKDLDVNHSFHFFDSGSRAFADDITITNNVFQNITGDIFRLNKEQDDLGIYNTEYLNVENNTFEKVQGSIVKMYRGGKDESTFGPHLKFVNNQITDSSFGKRNKVLSTLNLHGAQVALIEGNTFKKSAPVIIEHTVGEPVTAVIDNKFNKTDMPHITELYAPMPHSAKLKNNQHNK